MTLFSRQWVRAVRAWEMECVSFSFRICLRKWCTPKVLKGPEIIIQSGTALTLKHCLTDKLHLYKTHALTHCLRLKSVCVTVLVFIWLCLQNFAFRQQTFSELASLCSSSLGSPCFLPGHGGGVLNCCREPLDHRCSWGVQKRWLLSRGEAWSRRKRNRRIWLQRSRGWRRLTR